MYVYFASNGPLVQLFVYHIILLSVGAPALYPLSLPLAQVFLAFLARCWQKCVGNCLTKLLYSSNTFLFTSLLLTVAVTVIRLYYLVLFYDYYLLFTCLLNVASLFVQYSRLTLDVVIRFRCCASRCNGACSKLITCDIFAVFQS